MKTRVLLVEDDPDIRLIMTEGLKFLEMDVTPVESGEEAMKKLKFHQYDVMLLDMSLPGISGWDLARKMRLGPYKDLPIVALTGSANVGDEQRALQAGCSGYIPKPCEPNEVKNKITHILSKQKNI